MPSFSDQMKALTDEIFSVRDERADALAGMKKHTEELLGNARAFLKQLSDDHRAMAARMHSELATNHQERSAQVQAFRDHARRERHQAHERLRHMLDRNRADRRHFLDRMLHQFHQTQQQLAADFQAAAHTWEQLGQRRRPKS